MARQLVGQGDKTSKVNPDRLSDCSLSSFAGGITVKKNPEGEKGRDALREKAEEKLRDMVGDVQKLSADEVRRVLHELQVHQIELEIQNEDLLRTQQELAESQSRYADLYDFAPVGYFTFDQDGLILEANLTGASLLGVERNALIRKPFHLYVAAEDREDSDLHLRRVLRSGTRRVCEIRLMKKKEKKLQFPARLESVPVPSTEGEVTQCRTVITDITERRQAEEKVRENRERYRNLFENSPVGIYRTTPDGRILMANPALVRMLGCSSFEELAARNLEEEGFEPSYPRSGFKEIMESKGEVVGLEAAWMKNDGSVIFVRENAKAIRDAKGDISCYEGTAENITERKRAEEALRLSEDRLKKAQAIAHIGSWDWNIEENTLSWSEELYRIFGVSRDTFELSHGSIESLIHPEDIESNNQQVKRLLEEADSGEYSFRAVRPDGEIRHLNEIFEVLRDREGTAVRAFGTIQDVTERERLLQRLIQSEKTAAVGTLAYGIAHEFNNILAGIMANAEYGLSSDDVNQIKECFKVVVENSQRGSSITNSLLAVAGEKKRKRELANVRQALENVLSFSRRELEKLGIRVAQSLQDVPDIFCDPGEFSEVFLNMVNNARDAMTPKGGTLTVKIDHARDNIRIAFEDTGYGISEEIKDRIFDAFVTTKGALGSSKVPGTGLGLFVSRGIVDSYGGTIEVSSRPGKGARFTVIVPVTSNLSPERASKKEIETPEETDAKLNILLIDDEETICRVLKKFLESKGHRVTVSPEAEEGLEHFEEGKFDVVLSDITMPGMDGIELIRRIKEKNKSAGVIAITGHVRQETLDRAWKAGAQDILIKPFRSGELYESILRLHRDTGRRTEEKGAPSEEGQPSAEG